MELTYDPRYNIGYIRFREKVGQVETLHISDELNVDIAPDGTVCGIELLNANEQLGHHAGKIIILNRATGQRSDVELPIA